VVKLIEEIKYDASFIKSHSLQPQWYKVLKTLILLGFLVGYGYLFGWLTMLVFVTVFFFLSLLVHLLYRIKTAKWTQSWLDFVVVEENGETKPTSIGKFYYSAVIFNAILSLIVSQALR
jgi:hypothetical protein